MKHLIIKTQTQILLLLEEYKMPISVKEMSQYIKESPEVINLSLARLIQNGAVKIEIKEGQNVVVRTLKESLVGV